MRQAIIGLFLVLAACAAVYWPWLGETGLRATEGHRAIPGWEALETGRWLPTTMFGTVYVRKPPGMSWAVALSTMLFGENEFAARFPSAVCATLMSLVAFGFGGAWFGWRWGAWAGLAQALMPRFWPVGRTADIEALLCLGVQVASFSMVHALVHRERTGGASAWGWAAFGGAGVAAALLAKAHTGMPVLAGVLIGACVVRRSIRPMISPTVMGGLALGLIPAAPIGWMIWRATADESAVTEDVTKFLWDWDRVKDWAVLPAAVFAAGLPASLAVLFPWGRDAKREAASEEESRMLAVAGCLTVGFIAATGIYWAAGVWNERYVLPALVLLPALAGYVGRGSEGRFTPVRAKIARTMMLSSPWAMSAALLAGAGVYLFVLEPGRAATSGREAGISLAAAIPDGASVWSAGVVNAKPEVAWYARREHRRRGADVEVRWMPREVAGAVVPPKGTLMLINESERSRYERAAGGDRIEVLAERRAHKMRFWLVRVE